MVRTTKAAAITIAAGLAAAGLLSGGADATTANRRPLCESTIFNMPATVGGQVAIPVLDHAADPDLTPVRLVSTLGGSISDNGTPNNPSDDFLVFTRVSSAPSTVYLYWTVSDGALSAQCVAWASDEEPPDNG